MVTPNQKLVAVLALGGGWGVAASSVCGGLVSIEVLSVISLFVAQRSWVCVNGSELWQ